MLKVFDRRPLLVVVEVPVHAGRTGKVLDILRGQAGTVRSLKGNLGFAFYQTAENEESIAIIQRWTGRGAFERYRRSDVFQSFGAHIGPHMASPPSTTTAEVLG